MSKPLNSIKGYVFVAFLLLAALFGMQIMTFIFAQLGPQNSGLTVADVGYNQSVEVQNNSLNAIVAYTGQSDTQFVTVAIAITLLVLIALFFVFWKIFISGKDSMGGGNFG